MEIFSVTVASKIAARKTRSGPYAGSGWENPDRWSARNWPIRFKDLVFRTTVMLQKKINNRTEKPHNNLDCYHTW